MRRFGLSHLRCKKLKELLHAQYGRWISFTKTDEIRYASNVLNYIFRPKYIGLLTFCTIKLTETFKVPLTLNYTIDQIIDSAYSNFILGEYNLSTMGADYTFNTIRNVFKDHFKSKEYMINHYSQKLSLPIIQFLKKEFVDRDYLNVVIPVKISLMTIIREVESGIRDHVRKEFNLVRAGPYYNIRSPLTLVA